MIRMLYKRDHSEKELRTKLNQWYTAEAVEAAMVKANDQKWLKDPSELAVIMGGWLHRRGKGLRTVNQTLKQKGLPPLARDADQEIEKARTLLRKKFRALSAAGAGAGKLDLKDRQKAYRMLASRGYDHDTISLVIREDLGALADE